MKLLYITRSYSKNKGGKEIYNYNLVQALKKNNDIKLISTSGSIFKLIYFYPYSLIKGLFTKTEHIHLGDNFMLPIGIILKKIKGCRLSLTLYGLELTYSNKFYRKLFVKQIKKVNKIIAISEATKQAAKKYTDKDISVILCGINPKEFSLKESKEKLKEILEKKYNLNLNNKKILLTAGRLVKRKGIGWFVNNVMPKLDKNIIYLVSGEGKEESSIRRAVKNNNLQDRVFLLGRTSFETLKILYNTADIFVMPNISVKGDMEGFGIVAIEAGSVGLPVIASNIEGIKDAIINNKTGFLVQEKNTEEFINKINFVLKKKMNKDKIINLVESNFSWGKVAEAYKGVWRG